MMLRIIIFALTFFFLFSPVGQAVENSKDGITVYLDGIELSLSEPPFSEQNRILAPFRGVFEALGLNVRWDEAERTIIGNKEGLSVRLVMGSTEAEINGEPKMLDVPPMIKNGHAFVPLRFVTEASGCDVKWDQEKYQVNIISNSAPDKIEPKPTPAADDIQTMHYEWEYGGWDWNYDLKISQSAVEKYRSAQRNNTSVLVGFKNYINEPSDDAYIAALAQVFTKAAKSKDLGDKETLELVISFVQHIKYTSDGLFTEYPKYPLETLYDQKGDCEDTSILLVSLIREMGYDCSLIFFPGHVGVGISGSFSGDYFEEDGTRYYYVETTSTDFEIGELPLDLANDPFTIWVI